MHEPKPFASLTSSLLARKGAAKPAMRPQGYGSFTSGDDLGWNDMGAAHRAGPSAVDPMDFRPAAFVDADFEPMPALKPAADLPAAEEEELVAADVVPDVVRQQTAVAEGIGAEPAPRAARQRRKPAAVVSIAAARGAMPARAKAAFTLRLDPERHLRLRLACAVDNRSAQQIVTQALDEYLARIPEIDELAGRVAPRGKKQG